MMIVKSNLSSLNSRVPTKLPLGYENQSTNDEKVVVTMGGGGGSGSDIMGHFMPKVL